MKNFRRIMMFLKKSEINGEIFDKIEKGENIIFYKKNIHECFNLLMEEYFCVYFNEPQPVKSVLIHIINKKRDYDDSLSLNRKTIPELEEILIKELNNERLIILFNHFERLTNRSVQFFLSLNIFENVQFVCSFSGKLKKEVHPFCSEFEIINGEEYEKVKNDEDIKDRDEFDVTIPFYVLISLFFFFLYLKSASTLYLAIVFFGASWLSITVFRTLILIGGLP